MCAYPSHAPLHPEVNGFWLPCEISAGWRDVVHTATITSSILHWENYDVDAGYSKDPLEIIFLCVLSRCVSLCFPVKFEQCPPSPDTPACCCLFHSGSLWPLPQSFPSLKPKTGQAAVTDHFTVLIQAPASSGWGTGKCWVPAQPGQSKAWCFLMLVAKITLNRTAQLTHIFILVMFRPILSSHLPLFLSLYYDFIWTWVF